MAFVQMSAWHKLGVLAALCVVATVGELRVPNAEAVGTTAIGQPVDQSRNVLSVATVVSSEADVQMRFGADVDGPPNGEKVQEADDDAHLVPALFARDPDIRFVYFRQISKWM